MHPIEKAYREGFEEERSLSSRHPWPDSKAAAFLAASDWRERLPTKKEALSAPPGAWMVQYWRRRQAQWTPAHIVLDIYFHIGGFEDLIASGGKVRSRFVTLDGERAVWPEVGP